MIDRSLALLALSCLLPLSVQAQEAVDLRGLDALDVDPVSGVLLHRRADLTLGEGLQRFTITRTHSPWAGDPKSFGGAWSSTLDVRLEREGDRLVLVDERGSRIPFEPTEGRRISTQGPPAVLEEVASGYRLSGSGDGRRYAFDADGRLREHRQPGLRVRYLRDESGLLKRISGPWGDVVLQRDARGRLLSVSAPSGRTVRLRRDERGRLTAVTRGGLTERYGYDERGLLTSLAAGRATIRYDAQGRVVALGGPGVTPLRLRYSLVEGLGQLTRVDRGGVVTQILTTRVGSGR